MFNPVRSYKQYVQRLENKRKVFNPDKKTLDLQELNRFVNGTPEQPRTKPTYLLTKTRKLLGHTLVKDIDAGKYSGEQKQVAQNLLLWCLSPGTAPNTGVRQWLKQLANAKPVERKADELVKDRSLAGGGLVIDNRGDARSHISSEDDARSHISSEDDAKSHVSSKDVAPSPRSSKEEFDWSAAFHEASNLIEFGLNSGGLTELWATDADEARQGGDALDVSKHGNDPDDLSERVDAKIEKQRRRPAPMLRPSKSTQPPGHTVVRMVDNQILPAKQ